MRSFTEWPFLCCPTDCTAERCLLHILTGTQTTSEASLEADLCFVMTSDAPFACASLLPQPFLHSAQQILCLVYSCITVWILNYVVCMGGCFSLYTRVPLETRRGPWVPWGWTGRGLWAMWVLWKSHLPPGRPGTHRYPLPCLRSTGIKGVATMPSLPIYFCWIILLLSYWAFFEIVT